MNLSDLIEQYIMNEIGDLNEIELKRNDIAHEFNCVPSQVNYVISTRFIPELGFYVESKRGGNGYIRIMRTNLSEAAYIKDLIEKIGNKLSQRVVAVYLRELLRYNFIDEKQANIINAALSDKSLAQVDQLKRDSVRADSFKNILINLI